MEVKMTARDLAETLANLNSIELAEVLNHLYQEFRRADFSDFAMAMYANDLETRLTEQGRGILMTLSSPLYLHTLNLCDNAYQETVLAKRGWIRAIDEAMVGAHLGVAEISDSYADAKRKLNSLIAFQADVIALEKKA